MSFRSKNEDRLSHLPEDILSYILSLMPMKFSVRTSTLSKKWRYKWTLVTSLDFNDYHFDYNLNCFSTFVDNALKHCKTSQLQLFRITLIIVSMQNSKVTSWINEAVRLNVCELDLDLPVFELPISLFTCKTLTKLKSDKLFDFIVPSVVILPCLKTLEISVPRNGFVKAFKLINGCPMLESLSLVIRLHREQEDYDFNIPTLKRLKLGTSGGISSNKLVVLNVPNLEYLCVDGGLCSLFVIKNLSSLAKATVSLSNDEVRFDHLQAELLKGLTGAKSLSWSSTTLDVVLTSPLPKFPNLKHLELKGFFNSSWFPVLQHLESSSKLEHLCFQEPEGSCWIEPQSVPTWMLRNLKTLKITRCKGRSCDLRFIEYMLGNSEVLKTLTIMCYSLSINDEMQLCAPLI